MDSPAITKKDFCRRFVDHMIKHSGETFDDGSSIREYAEQAAPTYYDDPGQRAEGPEECADSDMSYWEEG